MAKKKKAKKAKTKIVWDQQQCLDNMRSRYGTQTNWADVEVYMTAHEVEAYFGPRCEDYEPLCGCCDAWLQWQRTGKVKITITREEALKAIKDG